jgi:hypothetical protein
MGCGSDSDFLKCFGSGSSSGFGSGSRQYLARIFQLNKIAQNLAFSMSEAAYFPESWPLIFHELDSEP